MNYRFDTAPVVALVPRSTTGYHASGMKNDLMGCDNPINNTIAMDMEAGGFPTGRHQKEIILAILSGKYCRIHTAAA